MSDGTSIPRVSNSRMKAGRIPVATNRPSIVPSDRVEMRLVALHARDLLQTDESAFAVTHALQLDHHVEGRGDLSAHGAGRQVHAGHADHLLQPAERVARRVGVDGGHRAFVTRVHRLQHVEGLARAHLTDDDPVRPHPQRVLDQLALRHLAPALDVGRPRLHARHVDLLELQLGRVLDRHDPLAPVDEGRHGVQQGRLSAAGASGDQHVATALDDAAQELGELLRQTADLDELVHVDRHACELADREQRAVDRERRDDCIDARAIGETRVDHRGGLVHVPAHGRDDLVDDAQEVRIVLEAHPGRHQEPLVLDEDPLVGVDQDVGDRVVLQQGLQRAESRELVQDLLGEPIALGVVELRVLLVQELLDALAPLLAHVLRRPALEASRIGRVEQALVQGDLELRGAALRLPQRQTFQHLGVQPRLGRRSRRRRAFRPACSVPGQSREHGWTLLCSLGPSQRGSEASPRLGPSRRARDPPLVLFSNRARATLMGGRAQPRPR
jgi:hypothetical protein